MCSERVPAHLATHESLWRQNPRRASLRWFREARFGLFVHYSLVSLLERGEVAFKALFGSRRDLMQACLGTPEEIARSGLSEADREKCHAIRNDLMAEFSADRFDADAICDLAMAAGMKYVTLTTRHAGGLFLNETSLTDFSAVHAPAGRDLVGKMAKACAKRGLGLFLYVPPDVARDDGFYRDRNETLLRELLTDYGPLAGIWFDGINPFYEHPERYRLLAQKFALVRDLQPHALVSFKEGSLGKEDFVAPEHFLFPEPVVWNDDGRQRRWEEALEHWNARFGAGRHLFASKPVEICTTMQECLGRDGRGEDGGWVNNENVRHLGADDVAFLLKVAWSRDANLLLNVGPRGDGSIHPDDQAALREVGQRLRA